MSATASAAVAPAMAPVIDWTTGAGRRLLSSFSQACNLALRRYYLVLPRGGTKSKLAAARTKVHATAATGNATNQQWRGGSGGCGVPGAAKSEATLPAFYRASLQRRGSPMSSFAAAPFVSMSSPLQTALLRELAAEVKAAKAPVALQPKTEARCFASLAVAGSPTKDPEPEQSAGAYQSQRAAAKATKLRAQPLWRFAQVGSNGPRSRVSMHTSAAASKDRRHAVKQHDRQGNKHAMKRSMLRFAHLKG